MNTVELFGGAMRANIPSDWVDISQVRDVPDNQEVYVDMTGQKSVIVEIVEHDVEISNENSGKHFLQGLIEDNGDDHRTAVKECGCSVSREGVGCGVFAEIAKHDPDAWQGFGRIGMAFSMFNHQAEERSVTMCVGWVRLPKYESDILVTLNWGGKSDPNSVEELMLGITNSLVICDYSLFGCDVDME